MSERPRTPTRAEIEQALARLRHSLAQVEPSSPAASAFKAAIERHQRMLAEIGEAQS